MKALRIQSKGVAKVVSDANKPTLRPDQLLIKTRAVALNPTDWKHIETNDKAGLQFGCDYAGEVVEVGEAVTKSWKKGDRIFGVVHGGNTSRPEDGSFAEYILAPGDLQMRLPDGLSYEEAATLGMGAVTVGQGLYQALELPWPDQPTKEKLQVLIYGGSSSMGTYGIQFAKASGLDVITTASEKNFDYVKSLGASAAFDYKSPTAGADIRKYTNNSLIYAWDAIAEHGSSKIISEALADPVPAGKKLAYASTLSTKATRDDVTPQFKLMYTMYGEEFAKWGHTFPASKEDYQFMTKFINVVEKLVAEGKIKPQSHEVRTGGIDGILDGLNDLKENKVSAKKLVYTIA